LHRARICDNNAQHISAPLGIICNSLLTFQKEDAVVNRLPQTDVCSRPISHASHTLRVLTVIVLLAFGQLLIAPSGWAKEGKEDTASEAGLGIASVLVSIPYGAVKVAYAIVGGITGGIAYVFTGGNLKAAQSVWDTSMRGTYIITPDHLRGEKPIRFLGIPPEAESSTAQGTQSGRSAARESNTDSMGSSSPMIQSEQAPAMQSGPGAASTQ